MADQNLFEIAARRKYRFPSTRGELTIEQLFDLPLTSRGGFDLDTVARAVNSDLKALGEESFVQPASNVGRLELSRKLDLVKAVIEHKQAVAAAAEQRQAKADKRRRILEALDNRENADLQAKSRDELLKELEALDEPAEAEAA